MHITVNKIRRLVLFSLLAASFFAVAQPPGAKNNPDSLLGRWRSLSTSKGGLGNMMTFSKAGILDYSQGAIVDCSYRLEGDQLIIFSETKDQPEQRETVTWLSDNQVNFQSSAVEGAVTFSRVGARVSTTNPLLGEWVGSREINGHTVQVIRIMQPDGKFLLLIPFLVQPGSYEASSDQLQVTLKNKRVINGAYRVADNILTLQTADSKESRYEKY